MSIITEIQRLQTAKSNIKSAIESKNITVPNSTKLDGYSQIISTIQVYDPYNGHDYVDLGLPSGVKWATMNIGANSSTAAGYYFQWGDTTGYSSSQVGSNSTAYKKTFTWIDYKFSNGKSSPTVSNMSKYNSDDNKTTLDYCDDAARANWGGNWRMPTTEEFQELENYTTSSFSNNCLILTSVVNGNTLTFPAAGYANNGSVTNVGNLGRHLSSSLSTDGNLYAYNLLFNISSTTITWKTHSNRYLGFPVRAVCN